MENKEIEMQSQPPDKAESESDVPAPKPPKRDYQSQKENFEIVPAKKKRFSSFQRPEFVYKPEKDSTYMTCLKNLLIFFNLLIWLFGAALLGLGIWICVDRDFWEITTKLDLKQFGNAAYILIAAGVVIMIIGFVGCYGAMALSLCMLVLYSIIIVIIILLELAVVGIVWASTTNKDTQDEMKRRAKKAFQEMSEKDGQRQFIDLLQTKLECCGVDGPDDYEKKGIPRSCNDPETGFPRKEGCFTKAVEYFKSKAGILGGVAISVFVIQVGALVITLCVACGLRQADKVI